MAEKKENPYSLDRAKKIIKKRKAQQQAQLDEIFESGTKRSTQRSDK